MDLPAPAGPVRNVSSFRFPPLASSSLIMSSVLVLEVQVNRTPGMVRYIGPLFLGFVLGYVDNEILTLS